MTEERKKKKMLRTRIVGGVSPCSGLESMGIVRPFFSCFFLSVCISSFFHPPQGGVCTPDELQSAFLSLALRKVLLT